MSLYSECILAYLVIYLSRGCTGSTGFCMEIGMVTHCIKHHNLYALCINWNSFIAVSFLFQGFLSAPSSALKSDNSYNRKPSDGDCISVLGVQLVYGPNDLQEEAPSASLTATKRKVHCSDC